MKKLSLVLVIAILVLAACGGGNAEPTAVPVVVEPAGEAPAAEEAPAAVEEVPAVEAPAEAAPVEGSAQEAIAAVLDVAMGDIYYGEEMDNMETPEVWEAAAGSEVTLNLNNNGGLEHDWAIVNPGEEVPVPFMVADHGSMLLWEAGIVPPGESSTDTFTAPTEPGEYTVICTVPGHYPSMQGRLIVN